MDQTGSPAGAGLESAGRQLFRRRVPRAAAGLGTRTAFRGGAGTATRRPQQRRPQTVRGARLHLSPLRHQPQRCPRRNLARLQPARRHGKPHRRTQARPRRRRFLPARVLRHRSRLPGRLAAVQPAQRVSARRRPARLPRTGHPAHPGVHLWRHPGTGGTTIGAPPVAKLGWIENTKPADRQNLKLGNPNFAEVGFCRSYLSRRQYCNPVLKCQETKHRKAQLRISGLVKNTCLVSIRRCELTFVRSPKYIRFAIVAPGRYGSVEAKANIVRAVLSRELPVVGNVDGTVAGLLVSYEGFQRLAHDERARENGDTRTIAQATSPAGM